MRLIAFFLPLILLHSNSCLTKKQAHSLFRAFLFNHKTRFGSKKEYDYRFDVFFKNLQSIEKENLEPTLDSKNRPMLGMSLHPKSKAKGTIHASYERAVNKFSLLTDKEFRNLYLMPYRALYGNKEYLAKRKQKIHSFEYFKTNYEKYNKTYQNYLHYQNPNNYNCKCFLHGQFGINQQTATTRSLGIKSTAPCLDDFRRVSSTRVRNPGSIFSTESRTKRSAILVTSPRPSGPSKQCTPRSTRKSSNYPCKKSSTAAKRTWRARGASRQVYATM